MVEEEPNVSEHDDGGQGSVETVRGVVRANPRDRDSSEYSYQMVYAQKSLRVLDLRLHCPAGFDPGYLPELLRTAGFLLGLAIARREYERINN